MINEAFAEITTGISLAAATETQLLTANGIDIRGADVITILVKNTGSNAIETITAYFSPTGTNFVALSTNFGSLAASASVLLEFSYTAAARMKLTGTSASGSTVTIEKRGARPS